MLLKRNYLITLSVKDSIEVRGEGNSITGTFSCFSFIKIKPDQFSLTDDSYYIFFFYIHFQIDYKYRPHLSDFVGRRLRVDRRGRCDVRGGLWQTLVLGLARRLARCSSYGDVLHRNALRSDVVDLTRRRDIDQIIGLNFDFISRRQERVKPHYEVRVAFE